MRNNVYREYYRGGEGNFPKCDNWIVRKSKIGCVNGKAAAEGQRLDIRSNTQFI